MLGAIARTLGGRPPVTSFERGLHDFSALLVQVTLVLTVSIFVLNALLHHPLFESLLFALAIAVGLTPQLLPAIVTISLSTGAQRMARKSVVVKRLVSIEDFGNIEILFTDKTGTLTEGRVEFTAALDLAGNPSLDVLRYGLLCNAAVASGEGALGGNPLDRALLDAPDRSRLKDEQIHQVAQLPFDYSRRRMAVLVEDASGKRTMVVKGAPESVLGCCVSVPVALSAALDAQFAAGGRVIAVATRDASGMRDIRPQDECDLTLAGLLVFTDPPKADAARSLRRLRDLKIEVKIVTGDNERVAQEVCAKLGLAVAGTLTGMQLDAMSDEQLIAALPHTTVFARIAPEQKSRIIRAQRSLGTDVGFLGDGVNDAVALHDADVGISVDTGADVAKDAADIVLLTKDLGILADGVVEGRRIFANTIKYVLMGTSSNFGNMVSTSGASLLIPFLPMLPSQILLNNLLYDTSELTIPTDNVDEELLQRPARWDMRLIRRFMLVFGPISSVFDFTIFGVMLWLFHAGEALFRSGFFVESFVTQTLVIFAIRTRRVPFWRSRPSLPLTATTLAACCVGAALPFSPLAGLFGFAPLPLGLFSAVMALILTVYFALVEIAKTFFYRSVLGAAPAALGRPRRTRIGASGESRRATRCDTAGPPMPPDPVQPSLAEPVHDVTRARAQPLETLFEPKSVAVIGATERASRVGRRVFENLTDGTFSGEVFAVNPAQRTVLGRPSYPSVGAIRAHVDVAIIITPAPSVPSVVEECVAAGVRGAIIISAGFREIGPAGVELERRIEKTVRASGIRVIGPNCFGVMSPGKGFNATFSRAPARPGSLGFASQSGALGSAILDWSLDQDFGFSRFVSVGSMLDVGWADILYYLGDDPQTKSIIAYMESVGDARSFMSAAREVALVKPIIVIKAGRSDARRGGRGVAYRRVDRQRRGARCRVLALRRAARRCHRRSVPHGRSARAPAAAARQTARDPDERRRSCGAGG